MTDTKGERMSEILSDGEIDEAARDHQYAIKGYNTYAGRDFVAGARFALAAAAEREKVLTAFAKLGMWALETHRENMGDLDGGDMQEKSLELGILHEVDVTEPCCEECSCAEWDDFPQKCIRMTNAALALVKEDR